MASPAASSPAAAALASMKQLVLLRLHSSVLALLFAAVFYVRVLPSLDSTSTVRLTSQFGLRRESPSRSQPATSDAPPGREANRCLCGSMYSRSSRAERRILRSRRP